MHMFWVGGTASYSIGLYSLKFIKPYGQRETHFEKKFGWRKVIVDMTGCDSKIQRETGGLSTTIVFPFAFWSHIFHFHHYFSPPTLFLRMWHPLSIGLYKLTWIQPYEIGWINPANNSIFTRLIGQMVAYLPDESGK